MLSKQKAMVYILFLCHAWGSPLEWLFLGIDKPWWYGKCSMLLAARTGSIPPNVCMSDDV